ncbi:hypothetical protein BS78_04G153000 [Paspalum vaginatum]|nr:hypothetical protein BS78_04G153000 [Paspalum vaginatum]
MAPRLPLVGALSLLLAVALGAQSCEGGALRLRGSVACLDCATGHDLSGVVVAVKCAGDGGGLHAAQTDARGDFDVAVPADSASPCAARVLGATAQLCAPQGLMVARVVPNRAPGSAASYALGSRLGFFTRCGASGSAFATTMDDRDQQGHAATAPELRPMPPAVQTPVWPPPLAGGNSPPFGLGGLPLIFLFPFIPIIGIP